jgi:hypothetical protein
MATMSITQIYSFFAETIWIACIKKAQISNIDKALEHSFFWTE